METPVHDLMHEHKAILDALNVLEKMRDDFQANKETGYGDILELLEFLKILADKCHHGKEEDYLFPALEEAGIKNKGGPIELMLSQHNKGRELIKKMHGSIAGQTIDKRSFTTAATSYLSLLRNHIQKEDNIVFPLTDRMLSEKKQRELMRHFEDLERDVIGHGRHGELHALLKSFKKKYLS